MKGSAEWKWRWTRGYERTAMAGRRVIPIESAGKLSLDIWTKIMTKIARGAVEVSSAKRRMARATFRKTFEDIVQMTDEIVCVVILNGF